MRAMKHRTDPGMQLLAQYGYSKLADGLHIRPNSVSQWDYVPDRWLLDVERITGIERHRLRPDLFKGYRRAA